MTPDRTAFGHDTTTDEVLDGIDLGGRQALVTGGSGGIGAETARALASKGASVVLTARNIEKGEKVAESIRASTGNDQVAVEDLELGSLASIRAFADRFLDAHGALHILVNNAGIMACPYDTTSDGFELQFGTNHLGHFLMTGLIAPALLAGAPARVVSVASRGHRRSPVVFDDIGFENREYDKFAAYGQSKTANVLFAVELDRRLGGQGVHANALHPGVIFTELGRHMGREDFQVLLAEAPEGDLQMKSVEAGAATSVFAATAPELEGRGGLYLEDCQIAEINDDEDTGIGGVRSYALDRSAAERLWAISEEMVGQSLSF